MCIFVLMQKFTIDRRNTGLFTEQQLLLTYGQDRFLPFLENIFSLDNIDRQVSLKQKWYSEEKRSLIQRVLEEHYSEVEKSEQVTFNLKKLKETTTFTVTTGHQLSLFTGPIFFIYKILHTIKLCTLLSENSREYHFVPVFWLASEDHDLEEIREVDVFGKKVRWETDQKGAVGRMSTEGLESLKSELRLFFKSGELEEIDLLLNAYQGKNLADATFNLVNKIFGKYGLLCLNADHVELKRSFIPVFEKEVLSKFSFDAVNRSSENLMREGFKVQVKPNTVNLFYINGLKRNKILFENPDYFIQDEGTVSQNRILELLHTHPECFSPNVVLRPLYQEYILPNICYVGGVGELSYWLQIKGVFDAVEVPFPLIHARTSVLFIDAITHKKMSKAGLLLEELFLDKEELKRMKLKENSSNELDFSEIERASGQLSSELTAKITSIDPGLEKYAGAEVARLKNQIEAIQSRLIKVFKQRNEDQLNAIDAIFERLFPDGMMQERVLNLFAMCPDGKISERIDSIYRSIDPLDPDLIILMEPQK
jgi:bacillithiol biosynthesis cysteine-adding enzyme BshC